MIFNSLWKNIISSKWESSSPNFQGENKTYLRKHLPAISIIRHRWSIPKLFEVKRWSNQPLPIIWKEYFQVKHGGILIFWLLQKGGISNPPKKSLLFFLVDESLPPKGETQPLPIHLFDDLVDAWYSYWNLPMVSLIRYFVHFCLKERWCNVEHDSFCKTPKCQCWYGQLVWQSKLSPILLNQ